MSIAFIFPGQGSQRVGMGKRWAEDHAASRAVFEAADGVVGFGLSELCFEGPEEDLQLTINTQPALLATSLAIHAALKDLGRGPRFLAGHSLGEYTALVVAGVLRTEDALRLVRERGRLMQEAVPVGEGGMAAILGLSADQVHEVADVASGDQVCAVANINTPSQTVVAGHKAAVDRAVEGAMAAGARRVLLLPVSAPFHSPLMRPAREGLTPSLEATEFKQPSVPVVTNIDAAPVREGGEARAALIRQIDGPVRWVESVEWMISEGGVDTFVEVGPGSVLTGLVRKIDRSVTTVSVSEPEDLEKLNNLAE